MKSTFYGHFVAGEDQVAIRPIIAQNRKFGVKSILDYSAEEDVSSEKAVASEIKLVLHSSSSSSSYIVAHINAWVSSHTSAEFSYF